MPDFVVDFIGDQVRKEIGMNFASVQNRNNSILTYGYLAEQYCLMLVEEMILQKEQGSALLALHGGYDDFPQKTMFKALYLFSKSQKINERDLEKFQIFLEKFSMEFFQMLGERSKG